MSIYSRNSIVCNGNKNTQIIINSGEKEIDWESLSALIRVRLSKVESEQLHEMYDLCGKKDKHKFLSWLSEHRRELLSDTMQTILGTVLAQALAGLMG